VVEVHGGFQDAHSRTARQILQAVQTELQTRKTNVLVVGHSLGGALALLDGVFLGLNLPSTTQLRVITYGMPRVSFNHY
jgi:predicted lipase